MWLKIVKNNIPSILILIFLTLGISYAVFHISVLQTLRVTLGLGAFYAVGLSWSYIFWSNEGVNGITRLVYGLVLSFFLIPTSSFWMIKIGWHLSTISIYEMMTFWFFIALAILVFLKQSKLKKKLKSRYQYRN